MGGHGHGHGHAPPYTVPSPDIYKVEDVPELKALQEKLAKKGLKDPWLRNEVWRFRTTQRKPFVQYCRFLFRGFSFAVPAVILTIAAEKALGIDYHAHADHHGDNHGHH